MRLLSESATIRAMSLRHRAPGKAESQEVPDSRNPKSPEFLGAHSRACGTRAPQPPDPAGASRHAPAPRFSPDDFSVGAVLGSFRSHGAPTRASRLKRAGRSPLRHGDAACSGGCQRVLARPRKVYNRSCKVLPRHAERAPCPTHARRRWLVSVHPPEPERRTYCCAARMLLLPTNSTSTLQLSPSPS